MSRKFYALNDENTLDCNLTELNASEAEEKGYQTHNDWLAHNDRYAYVWKNLAMGPKKLKEAKTLLDVGCGKLQLPHFFWRNKYSPAEDFQYWGLELRATEKWLDAVGWKRAINLVKCDLVLDDIPARIPEFPAQFDVVVCFETFEHVPRAMGPRLMQNLFNWTKPGGTVFFSTPNAGVSDSTADNHIGPDGISREWSYEDKLALARSTGFNIIETFGTFCGTTRLPEEVQERIKTDPFLAKIKKYHTHARFTTFMSVAYPEFSNNALFHMERPA